MKVVATDTATGDLRVTERRFTLETELARVVATRVANALKVCRGEWAFDTSKGFPYYPFLLGVKNPDLGTARALLTAYIEELEGVAYADLSVALTAERRAQFSGSVKCVDGSVIELRKSQIFVEGSPL
jgi:hypothetical protein